MPTTLTDLPAELLDHVISYLPSASSIANLSASSQSLHTCVEKEGWKTFATTQFPSLCPLHVGNYKHASRSLATVSKAIDRRALVTNYVEPNGHITALPGGRRLQKWKRPSGQTIGFTPHLDVYEQTGHKWSNRREVLAFSAGAELVVRETFRENDEKADRCSWITYKPRSASEGMDDITSVNILRPPFRPAPDEEGHVSEHLIVGTANGDLQLLSLPNRKGTNVVKAYFNTQVQPIRSTSLWQSNSEKKMLAANLGDSRICVYPVDGEHGRQAKVAPSSEVDVFPDALDGNVAKSKRVWGTTFLSSRRLAVGLGPSEEPVAVYELRDDGLSKGPIRTFGVQNIQEDRCDELAPGGIASKPTGTVYPMVPLPPFNAASASEGDLFLSGGYDGIIRLHDLRSNKDVEQTYIDPIDDSAIYCLLPRGRETIIAGASRHSYLKFFDMRMGAKCYQYQDTSPGASKQPADWNLFLNPLRPPGYRPRGFMPRGTANSIYTLASASHHSPYIYAGVENAVAELAITSVLDRHPDPVLGHDFLNYVGGLTTRKQESNAVVEDYTLNFACCSHDSKLLKQRNLRQTLSHKGSGVFGLDERWEEA